MREVSIVFRLYRPSFFHQPQLQLLGLMCHRCSHLLLGSWHTFRLIDWIANCECFFFGAGTDWSQGFWSGARVNELPVLWSSTEIEGLEMFGFYMYRWVRWLRVFWFSVGTDCLYVFRLSARVGKFHVISVFVVRCAIQVFWFNDGMNLPQGLRFSAGIGVLQVSWFSARLDRLQQSVCGAGVEGPVLLD